MNPTEALVFLGILTLSGLFSGTETALTAVSDVTVVRMSESGSKSAKLLQTMLKEKGRVIAALLVGNNIVNVVLAVYATVVFNGMLQADSVIPPWAAPIVASVCSVSFLLVFGEVLPKTIAVSFRNQWARVSAYPVFGLMLLVWPLTWMLIHMSDVVMRMFGRRPGEDDIFELHEIHAMASMGEQAGAIDNMEMQLIQRAAHLNDRRVREIMIPRTDIQAIEDTATIKAIRKFFQKTPFSRIPVYHDDLDDIVGILNFKEFLRHEPRGDRGFDLMAYLHKPLFVPEFMFIGDLLNEMRAQRTHLAIVLDEYGGTAGLLSLEDVVEMLVGRIEDEYDAVAAPFEQIDERTWIVDGRVIDERLVSRLGLDLPQDALEGFDTVAGLALTAFGNIPSEGDSVTYHGMEITAVRVKGHRVRRVRFRVLSPKELEQQQADAQNGMSTRGRVTRKVTVGKNEAGADAQKSLNQPQLVTREDEASTQESK